MQMTVRELPSPFFSHLFFFFRGQEKISPVLIVIRIHSTPHPATNNLNKITQALASIFFFEGIWQLGQFSYKFLKLLNDITVISARVAACQFGCDGETNQAPLETRWVEFVTFVLGSKLKIKLPSLRSCQGLFCLCIRQFGRRFCNPCRGLSHPAKSYSSFPDCRRFPSPRDNRFRHFCRCLS